MLEQTRTWCESGMVGVWAIAVGTVVVHVATGWRYGFNRDELMALEDARHLAWGYVQYPPVTAFFGRVALTLFGTSLVGFRFFAALAQALALVLTGMMAKEMARNLENGTSKIETAEGERSSPTLYARSAQRVGHPQNRAFGDWAAVVAAGAGVPFCLGGGALMQYISFDYLCWVLVAYAMVKVLGRRDAGRWKGKRSDGARWWVLVGLGIGLGMMAKYTMGFLAVGVVVGVLSTEARRFLKSGWPWLGLAAALVIFLPNFLWQWERNFVSVEFLRFVHARDVKQGLTDWFLPGQAELTLLAFPLALAGLWFCFVAEEGKRWRTMGWMYVAPLVFFMVLRGRDYYLAPAYPMLYAAGAVWVERESQKEEKWNSRRAKIAAWLRRWLAALLVVDAVVAGCVALPIMPVNSRWWKLAAQVDTVLPEEIGWPELVETVAKIRDGLPDADRAKLGILAGNYGEVGALNLYGERYGLPRAISGVNSSWERGFLNPPPATVIVVGYSREFLEKHFASCVLVAHTWNRYGVTNEETVEDPDIFVCGGLKESWEEFWKRVRLFA